MKKVIHTDKAPAALGPYSQVKRIYCIIQEIGTIYLV